MRFKTPHTSTILLGIIIVAALCTWIIPAWECARVEMGGRTEVDPEGFSWIGLDLMWSLNEQIHHSHTGC
jgi:uncharacterized ion transporter superfamily protein YfcC